MIAEKNAEIVGTAEVMAVEAMAIEAMAIEAMAIEAAAAGLGVQGSMMGWHSGFCGAMRGQAIARTGRLSCSVSGALFCVSPQERRRSRSGGSYPSVGAKSRHGPVTVQNRTSRVGPPRRSLLRSAAEPKPRRKAGVSRAMAGDGRASLPRFGAWLLVGRIGEFWKYGSSSRGCGCLSAAQAEPSVSLQIDLRRDWVAREHLARDPMQPAWSETRVPPGSVGHIFFGSQVWQASLRSAILVARRSFLEKGGSRVEFPGLAYGAKGPALRSRVALCRLCFTHFLTPVLLPPC